MTDQVVLTDAVQCEYCARELDGNGLCTACPRGALDAARAYRMRVLLGYTGTPGQQKRERSAFRHEVPDEKLQLERVWKKLKGKLGRVVMPFESKAEGKATYRDPKAQLAYKRATQRKADR